MKVESQDIYALNDAIKMLERNECTPKVSLVPKYNLLTKLCLNYDIDNLDIDLPPIVIGMLTAKKKSMYDCNKKEVVEDIIEIISKRKSTEEDLKKLESESEAVKKGVKRIMDACNDELDEIVKEIKNKYL